MSDVVRTAAQAAGLELEPLLVLEPLEAFLDAAGLGAGPIEATAIGGGHSNVTYLLRRGEEKLVLRRPPRGPLPPSAHDVLREARLLSALGPLGFRVPAVLTICEDSAVIGAPFYVMPFVEGHVLTATLPPEIGDGEVPPRIAEELVDCLVDLHAIDVEAAGLTAFGRPDGYLERQIKRFGGLLELNATRPLPDLERVAEWLADNVPDSPRATVVHGDYRLGNVMYADGAPARLVSIFDWELATIGDPLADVGYLLATWGEPGDEENPISALGGITRRPGFPTRGELVERYEQGSGRSMSDVPWFMALALWKSAIFLEGSYKRRLAGTTEDPWFDLLEHGVPAVADRAWKIARST